MGLYRQESDAPSIGPLDPFEDKGLGIMRRWHARSVVKTGVAVVAATGLAVLAAPGAQAAGASASGHAASMVSAVSAMSAPAPTTVHWLGTKSGFQELVDTVVAQVHQQYPAAVLVEIDGRSPNGPVSTIYGITEWRFVFNDQSVREHYKVILATVNLPSPTATITVEDGVYVGSLQITKPVAMGPTTAWAKLRGAGYLKPFEFVTYRQPIAGSFAPNPLYIFSQGEGYVGVDTVTGVVAPIR